MPKDALNRTVVNGDALAYWTGGPQSYAIGIGLDGPGPEHTIKKESLFRLVDQEAGSSKRNRRNRGVGDLQPIQPDDPSLVVPCGQILKFHPPGKRWKTTIINGGYKHEVVAYQGEFGGLYYRKLTMKRSVRDVLAGNRQWRKSGIEVLFAPANFDETHTKFREWRLYIKRTGGSPKRK